MTDTEWTPPDTWCVMIDTDGRGWLLDQQEEHRLDAAVSAYKDSGGTRDSVLTLTLIEGASFRTSASVVRSWYVSSPEHRRRNVLRIKWQEEEERALRAEAGIWENPA